MKHDGKYYYEARGFSAYYFANVVFNIVKSPSLFMRGIEEILGDLRTQWLLLPFKRYTNLHEFVRSIINTILFEGIEDEDEDLYFFRQFLRTYQVSLPEKAFDDRDALVQQLSETQTFDEALESLADEVFHILFADVGFLYEFNRLCAQYITDANVDEDHQRLLNRTGTLKRVKPPAWTRHAIYHRDKGECRECKKSLSRTINQIDSERYDHIVSLAEHGANDITNLQLLCEPCNSKKSSTNVKPSRFYVRALQT